FNAFTYETDALRVHRYWKIGVGKIIPYSTLPPNDAFVVYENSGGALSEEIFWNPLGQPRTREEEEDDYDFDGEDAFCDKSSESKKCEEKKKFVSALYRCPVESCAKEYLHEKDLEKHLKAVHAPTACKVVDDAVRYLTDDNENGKLQIMGWALPQRRKSHRFPPAVKEFLREIYDEGERTGVKTDARGAELLMREARGGGSLKFSRKDLLNGRQIAGVYTGFKKTKKKKVGEEEVEEIDEKEVDEVNDLFQTEGDEELEFETEPLFNEEEHFRVAVKEEHHNLFEGEENEEEME
ncbi:hypothetical protein PFISCL1PPCAC_18170, partial [Pristionchus fissidentatus]